MRLRMPNTGYHTFVAALIMLALAVPGAQAQDARAQPPDANEGALSFRGSEVASLITRIVERQLLTIPGVHSVHDLHLHSVSSGIDAMSAHIVVTDMAEAARILKAVQRISLSSTGSRKTDHQVPRATASLGLTTRQPGAGEPEAPLKVSGVLTEGRA